MKSVFVKELEQKQEIYLNWKRNKKIPVNKECFPIQKVQICVEASEEAYFRMFQDSSLKSLLKYIESMTGISLSFDRYHKALNAWFLHQTFFCNRVYYGKFLEELEKRLQIEFGDQIHINVHKRIERLKNPYADIDELEEEI